MPFQSMRGVAARYPAYSETLKRPIDLQGQINHCRAGRQGAAALPPESPGLLALTVFAAHQSRGMPVAGFDDSRLQASISNGKSLYEQRIGQLNFSCGNCHTDNAGKRLAGNAIPEAHPTGYPVYRLEWQSLGSLQRRLRNCMTGVRAEAFPYGSGELIDLELYLMQRARGMAVETPAVRP